jgi:hypothetical protein
MRQVVLVVLMNLVNEYFWGVVEISVRFVLVMLARVMKVVKLIDWADEEVGKILAGFVLSSSRAVVSMMTFLMEICFCFSLVTSGIYFSSLGLCLVMKVSFVASSMSSWGSFSL